MGDLVFHCQPDQFRGVACVVVVVFERVLHGLRNHDGSGEMQDGREAFVPHQGVQPVRFGQIGHHQPCGRQDGLGPARGEIVINHDIIARFQQGQCGVRADIPGAAGDQNFFGAALVRAFPTILGSCLLASFAYRF